MIFYDPTTRIFALQAATSTYAMGVHPAGYLCHLHWGARLVPDATLLDVLDRRCMGFAAEHVQADGSRVLPGLLPLEYPTADTGDFRQPALEVTHADGTRALRLRYDRHESLAGKPALAGLPATYVEAQAEAATLRVTLVDDPSGLAVELNYTVFAGRDVIVRSTRVINGGANPVTLRRVASAALDFDRPDFEMLHLPGAWARERWVERQRLHSGTQSAGSRRGASSHQHHPFFALLEPGTTETTGEVRAFSFVYSGNHLGSVEVDEFFNARAMQGIHPEGFTWQLAPGAAFQAPESVLAFAADGLGGMSREYHRLYRERLVRGQWRDAERPVLINNWEATYFNFDADKLVAIAERAKPIGLELFVLDDGWFGRRNDDRTSLGDWFVDNAKLPQGIADVARRITDTGVRFGLWFEPEMISEQSELFKAHPDWALQIPGRPRTEGRNQLVLDFSRPEVVDGIYSQMTEILRAAPISYVKWDMNRHLTEVASVGRAPAQQGETAHRHLLGVYSFMDRITKEFPQVLFEGCSGGGGRYDPGMLHYMPQFWASDNTDAICRLRIQHGTSLIYPPCTMGSHISAVPNHLIHRVTPLLTRGHVAAAGQFGFELDLTKLTPEEVEVAKEVTALVKSTRHLLRTGDLHRLVDPTKGNLAAWSLVAPDASEAVVTAVLTLAEVNWRLPRLKLRGLDPHARYHSVHGPEGEWPGDVLMEVGLALPIYRDFESVCWHLKRVS
jgi:alpha-galactosidase